MGNAFGIERILHNKTTKRSSDNSQSDPPSSSPLPDTVITSAAGADDTSSVDNNTGLSSTPSQQPLSTLLVPNLQVTSLGSENNDPSRLRSASMGSKAMHWDVAPPHVSDQSKMRISQSTGALDQVLDDREQQQQHQRQQREKRRRQRQRWRRRKRTIGSVFNDMCVKFNACGNGSLSSDEEQDNHPYLNNTHNISEPSESRSRSSGEIADVSKYQKWRRSMASGAKSWLSSSSSGASEEAPYLASPKSDTDIHTDLDALCQAIKSLENVPGKSPPMVHRTASNPAVPTVNNDFVSEYYDGRLGPKMVFDDASELDFQQRKHFLLKRVWGGIYQAKIRNPKLIVHWMCSSGHWEPEMAREFPNAKIIGLDYKPVPSGSYTPKNVEFRQMRAQSHSNGIHGLEKFAENSVDLLVLRDLWILGSKNQQGGNVLERAFKILKPGGWLEIYDQDRPVVSGGPNFDQLERWIEVCKKIFNVSLEKLEHMVEELEAIGFTNVNSQSVELPVGEWASTPMLKETGYFIKDLRRRRFLIRAPGIRYSCNVSDSKLRRTLRRALDDCEDYRAHTSWYCFNAQKPLS
ncbi:hypothetical protein BDB00DRAFT_871170 [Zychaea mexicana]|uniref:uncharacterized protein n=1 Tax=Zychaea mexicana TaxID=64656 RepID=UPI0022FDE3D7|nr:uncharacterized protein BDB00DRAFT_871170 [Zychaea mexicana]KAI9494616.1 hypothetical protein BDB00DRAFT_871170 [Zychaea mexicana]